MDKNEPPNIQVEVLFKEFSLLSYSQKLEQFHLHFGIVPLSFPKMNTDIPWFYEEPGLQMLMSNLNAEIKNRHIYEKSFTGNGNIMLFDIKPKSQSQRIQYNTFLLSVFSSELYTLSFNLPEEFSNNPYDCLSFLNAKNRRIYKALADMKLFLQSRINKLSLKHQFVKVFYTGIFDFDPPQKINLHVRHKFVELYLYSYGIAIGSYLHQIQSCLQKII